MSTNNVLKITTICLSMLIVISLTANVAAAQTINNGSASGNATAGSANVTGGNVSSGNATTTSGSANVTGGNVTANTTAGSANVTGGNVTANTTGGSTTANATGGNNSTNASSGNNTTIDNSTSNPRAPVTSAIAPALSAAEDTCMGSTSMGAQGVSFGLSLGSTWRDADCVRRKDARELHNMGHTKAAMALMCQNDDIRQAMEDAGEVCPSKAIHKKNISQESNNSVLPANKIGLEQDNEYPTQNHR